VWGDQEDGNFEKLYRREGFGAYDGQHVREFGNFGRLRRSKMFIGQGGRQTWEVREKNNFGRLRRLRNFGGSGGLDRLGGRHTWQDPLAYNIHIFGASC
jgi:hypothetical protein